MTEDEKFERLPSGDDWPPPREDPEEEPHHKAGRIADRDHGMARGDVEEDE